MKRRALCAVPGAAALSALAWLAPLRAQTPRAVRLGVLAHAEGNREEFSRAMTARGWDVGRNLQLAERHAGGDPERFPALARELVAERVDVILAISDQAADAAVRASRTIPVVMMGLAPVEHGLAKSLARPGGNVTGVVYQAPDYAGKQIGLLRAIAPRLRRLGIVENPGSLAWRVWHRSWLETTKRLGLELATVPSPYTPADIDATLAEAERENVQSIEFGLNFMLPGAGWGKIRPWALRHKVLTSAADLHRGDAMLSFGANSPRFLLLLADQLDRVMRGADPATLPIQQPTVFDIVVHRGQLRAIGLEVPRSVLLEATEVID